VAENPSPGEPVPEFMSVRQTARYLQLNEKKIYALAADGAIPATKVTGKWLFPRRRVDEWLIESSHGGVLTDRLVIAGSDDPLLARVTMGIAESVGARALVSYAPTGTRLGLELLAARRADACAIHWGPAAQAELRHPQLISDYPAHRRWVILRLGLRQQGLMVTPELAGESLETLCAGARRWVFRQSGAGSQHFLNESLTRLGIDVDGLQRVADARSEREAAACIAMGEAEIAPGARAAAVESGLGFVAIGWEAFDVVTTRAIYFRDLFQRLLSDFASPANRALAANLRGYDLEQTGALVWSAG